MRAVLYVGATVVVFAAGVLIAGQARNETKEAATAVADDKVKEKGVPDKAALPSRTVLANLQTEIETQPFRDRIKFGTLLEKISETLQRQNKPVTFYVDGESFRENAPDWPDLHEEEIAIRSIRSRASVRHLLSEALKQTSKGMATFIVRDGRVDIVAVTHVSKRILLNQTFHAEFKEQRLEAALAELSDLTGVSIVVDARARQKAQTTVTARFNDDVALQDAVRVLADMADLKIVYLVTCMYVTTPEHALTMQKELKAIYEPATPASSTPPAIMAPDPFAPFYENQSPLAPPLPPERGPKRLEAAA